MAPNDSLYGPRAFLIECESTDRWTNCSVMGSGVWPGGGRTYY